MAHSAAVGTMVAERETISTWHAPTVRRYADTFQREFDELFDRQDGPRGSRSSAEYAIDWIDCRIDHLKDLSTVPERCQECKLLQSNRV
jgi:hypothetical protein